MRVLIAMGLSLGLLIALLHNKVKLGRAMVFSAIFLAILLYVSPAAMQAELISEWQGKPFTETTGYLFFSLTAILMQVNIIGSAMQKSGVSKRLVPALQGLFRSRRVALTAIPLMMGLLPTPGGIMLSAPMVRDLGDSMGIKRSRLAAINFYFRHQWETIWPLFPAVPLIQGMLGISAFKLISHNLAIAGFGVVGGILVLLLVGIPPRKEQNISHGPYHRNIKDVLGAFWPIALVAIIYALLNMPPAIGLLVAILGFLCVQKVPVADWRQIFRAGWEPDFALLIFGALFFKLNLQTVGAAGQVVEFLTAINVPTAYVIFFLPFFAGLLTGVTMPTVAITFPFLLPFIGTGESAKMGLEVLAFSGLLCGVFITPVHLCLPLSAGYFKTDLAKIIAQILIPVAFMAAAGIIMATFAG